MMKRIIVTLTMIAASLALHAQHEHHQMQDTTRPANKKDTMMMDHYQMHHHDMKTSDTMRINRHQMDRHNMKTSDTMPMNHHQMHHDDMQMNDDGPSMSHAYSLHLPMQRNGSGTGWLPDASPMYGYMIHTPQWMYMVHGNVFLRYNNQDFTNKGSRGGSRVDAPNWFMLMGQHRVGMHDLFHFSTMLSLDNLVTGGRGYPLLFQTGESYKGQSLVDRQHPHDLFAELSASYAYSFSKNVDLFAYVGYPGEPALGPVTFMHRPSALDNPNAPISHHWVDATHITFGVATLGLRAGKFKIEGSSFTGREPDENRYDLDKPHFDSWSGRLSFNPSRNWALQVSHGFVKSPEELHADEDVNKTTASAIYNSDIRNNRYFSGTLLWGMNKQKDHDGENAVLAEGVWHWPRATLYSRYEYTQKSSEELVLDEAVYGHSVFSVHALTAGFNYDVLHFSKLRLAAGGNYTVYSAEKKLESLYGKNPMAFQLYIRLYPPLMRM